MMQMILHTFKKDSRRLWLPIAATLVLLMELAQQDRWRSSWLAGAVEGWLNILLPLAWACLLGMTVEEEPLAGDRQFWITRPHRWSELLGAKASFALAYIHLPMLLADAWILATHGFQPWEWVPQLLAKQALVALAVTLPSIALATLVPDFTHFVLGLFALGVGFIVVGGGVMTAPWDYVTPVRHSIAIVVLGIAAGGIALLQYALRRTAVARVVGVAAAVGAGALFGYLPAADAWAILPMVSPVHGKPVLELLPPPDAGPVWSHGGRNRILVPLPIALTGPGVGPLAAPVPSQVFDLTVIGADGARFEIGADFRGSGGVPPFASMTRLDTRSWLLLGFSSSSYEKVRRSPVTVAGHTVLAVTSKGAPLPLADAHCSSTRTEDSSSPGMLKILCESPSDVPRTLITLRVPATGQEWKAALGDSTTFFRGPRGAWLSPLNRRETFFHLGDGPRGLGTEWQVPAAALDTARITVQPEPLIGYAAVEFRFEGVRLADYVKR